MNCDWTPASCTSGQPNFLVGIQIPQLRRKRATLSLARRGMEPGHQRSTVHRVGVHGISNRDTYLYPPHNNSSVYLTATAVRRSGRITDGMQMAGQHHETPHFYPDTGTPF